MIHLWRFTINCLVKTFACACVVLGAGLPYLFWLGFGHWPYIIFLVIMQCVFAFMGLGVIAWIVRMKGLSDG